MKKIEFPKMTATDIECRVGQGKDVSKGFSLLLYKDARVDQRILDETMGAFNWQREHIIRENIINGVKAMVNYCKVSLWDEDKNMWVSKEDCGIESNTEQIKGESSDAFKRACFNWGIGRELYTAPFIWIKPLEGEVNQYGKLANYVKFRVKEIEYDENGRINYLDIVDINGKNRFHWVNRSINYAIAKAKEQTTIEGLVAVWNEYPQYQSNNIFSQVVTDIKKDIMNGGKKPTTTRTKKTK